MKKIHIVILCLCAAAALCFFKYQNNIKPEERILMINNKLYHGTSETGPMGDSGCIGGEITSSVEKDEVPAENNQSNFGNIGSHYTKDDGSGKVMVCIDNSWYWFTANNNKS